MLFVIANQSIIRLDSQSVSFYFSFRATQTDRQEKTSTQTDRQTDIQRLHAIVWHICNWSKIATTQPL